MLQNYKIGQNQPTRDEVFMQRCIDLARFGEGHVAPNPLVGAVVVYNNKIIGEGYHQYFGGPHAEVNAVNRVKDKGLLKQSTLYVNLEPCAHHGKTPPCADLIVHYQIPEVVIGMQDPFSKVNGAGIKRLNSAGCQVKVGILEKECHELNLRFITFHGQMRPYVILKWAQTLDGFIDKTRNENSDQHPNWITNELCRALVHKWRTEVQSIMVGTNTALIDNPKLNVRAWSGTNPLRIVIDRDFTLPNHLSLFDQKQPTLVLNSKKNETKHQVEYLKLPFNRQFIPELFESLYNRGISGLLVEGGFELLQSFIDQNLWDEARIFTGSTKFMDGVKAPVISGNIISYETLDHNILTVMRR